MNSDKIYTAAIIGVGRGGEGRAGGHSIGYAHANTYQNHPRTRLVTAADISDKNLKTFLSAYGLPQTAGFIDHKEMLRELQPEIVSVCTYVGTHRPIIEDAIEAGVKGIFCEKPFTLTMDDARAIGDMCSSANVKLVANHYRRDLHVFRKARQLVADGAIGTPLLFFAGIDDWDQMEWGAHWLDAFRALTGDQDVRHVAAVVDCSGEKVAYGHVMEEYSYAAFTFADGTRAILEGGRKPPGDSAMRLIGEKGILDIVGGLDLRLTNEEGLKTITCESSVHADYSERQPRDENGQVIQAYPDIMDGLIGWIEGDAEPSTGITNAIKATEMYLGAYEAGRQGKVLEFPIGPQDTFPLDEIARRHKQSD